MIWLRCLGQSRPAFASTKVLAPVDSVSDKSPSSTRSRFQTSTSHRQSGAPCQVSSVPIPRYPVEFSLLTSSSGYSQRLATTEWPVRGRRAYFIFAINWHHSSSMCSCSSFSSVSMFSDFSTAISRFMAAFTCMSVACPLSTSTSTSNIFTKGVMSRFSMRIVVCKSLNAPY